MRNAKNILKPAWLAGAVILCTSCATTNTNPPVAKPHTGYVDFYSPGNPPLSWEVKRWDPKADAFKTVFSKVKPLPGGVLRLESAPGLQRFQITFLNRVVQTPAVTEVRVEEGMVTPVKVELLALGQTSVVSKEQEVGANIQGAGRKTQYSTQAGTVNQLVASAQPPMPYRPQEQTRYPP